LKNTWKKRVLITLVSLLAIVLVIALLKLVFIDFVIDFMWFQSQGMTGYFLLRLLYRYLVFAFSAAVFFGIFYVNFLFASRLVEVAEEAEDKHTKNLVKMLHSGLRRMYLPLSIVMALPIAFPMYTNWEKALLFFFSIVVTFSCFFCFIEYIT